MTARCRWCRRRLARPTVDGLGPVCRARLTPPAPAVVVTVPAGTVGHVPGQTALALTAHQPSLWSL